MNAPIVFDRALIKTRRARALKTLPNHDFLFKWAEDQLLDRLSDIRRTHPLALHVGARQTSGFSDSLKNHPAIDSVYTMDVTSDANIIADEELLPFKDQSFNLITSTLTLHSVNDLPGALVQIRKSLKPDGLFMAAMLGGETLYELRDCLAEAELSLKDGVSPRIAPFADKQQMGGLMQRAGFALPVVDSDIIEVTYPSIMKLLHDLRGMGEGNVIAARDKSIPPKTLFKKAEDIYKTRYPAANDRITTSFEIIFLTGWSPHDSQQKPLRPGSAENTLAEALDTKEVSLDEKATP